MRSRWEHDAPVPARAPTRMTTVLTLVLALTAFAACGGGGSGNDRAGDDRAGDDRAGDDRAGGDQAPSTSASKAKPDGAAFCRTWRQFQTGTSYHPDMAAYRQFWGANDKVAKQLVGVAPTAIGDDVAALAKGVASVRAAVERATSPRTWSPAETKLYMEQVRLPEVQVSNYADQECGSVS